MKYVFYIHSSITYILFKSVEAYLKLNKEDIILIIDRNFKDEEEYKILNISNFVKKPSYNNLLDFQKTCKILNEFIRNGLDSNFYLFIPHCNNLIYQLLTKSPRCKGVSIIEEGLLAYSKREKLLDPTHELGRIRSMLFDLKLRVLSLNKLKLLPFIIEKKIEKLYCLNNYAFTNFKNKVIVHPYKIKHSSVDKILPPNIYCLTDYNVFKLDRDKYFGVIELVINQLREKGIKTLGIKLHPNTINDHHLNKFLDELIEKNKPNFNINILPSNLLLELFLFEGGYIIYGTLTSLQVYAALFNNKIICDSKVLGIKIGYQNIFPKFFNDNVIFIE